MTKITPIVLLLAFTLIQQLTTAQTNASPQPGQARTVLVEGRKLNLVVMGNGKTTVVLESGLGSDSSNWKKVQPEIAKFTRVVAYDRAGYGKSEPGPKPRSAKQVATELHSALKAAGIKSPYILVGHSLGGLHIRSFATMYPEEVAGLVFVDPLHEIWLERTKDHKDLSKVQEFMQKAIPKAPQHIQDEFAATMAGIEEAKAMGPLPNVPATVLTSTRLGMSAPTTELMLLQISIHNSLAKQIPEARHILTDKSGHVIQDDEPELVIESIRQVWEKSKGKKHRT